MANIVSKLGYKVIIEDKTFQSISLKHPELKNQEEKIKETIIYPDEIRKSKYNEKVLLFYKLFHRTPVTRKYLTVVIKILNGDGFLITSYFTDRIKLGEEIWKR